MLMALDRRLQVLVDAARYERLERTAQSRGTSVATLVREAIDIAYPVDGGAAEAAAWFLSRPPLDLGDWDDAKREIERGMERGLDPDLG